MGYRKVSAAEQVFYIIKYAVRQAAKRLRSRLRHWLKRGKGCRHCCLWCKYFEQCSSEEVEQVSNGVIITAIICATLIVLMLISNKKK